MKVYQKSCLVTGNDVMLQKFLDDLNEAINKFQSEGLQVEIQYSSSQGTAMFCYYSALILAYTEEPNV